MQGIKMRSSDWYNFSCDNFAHDYYRGILDQKAVRSTIHESYLPELEDRVKRVKKEDEDNWVD